MYVNLSDKLPCKATEFVQEPLAQFFIRIYSGSFILLFRAILFDKLNINEGMLIENVVAHMLRLHRERLYFYSHSDSANRENHMEIDFLITRQD